MLFKTYFRTDHVYQEYNTRNNTFTNWFIWCDAYTKQSFRQHDYTIKVAVLTFFDLESVISHYIAIYGTHPF